MVSVDKLLEKPCYVIDFLPQPVPKNSGGQFFRIENYLLNHSEQYGIAGRFTRILLKIMCYYPVAVHWGEWIEQPSPEQISDIVRAIIEDHSGYMDMLFPTADALLQFEWDCLHISVYNPDAGMRSLFEKIAASEGMFWRKAQPEIMEEEPL